MLVVGGSVVVGGGANVVVGGADAVVVLVVGGAGGAGVVAGGNGVFALRPVTTSQSAETRSCASAWTTSCPAPHEIVSLPGPP